MEEEEEGEGGESDRGTSPMRYVPLLHVYSSTDPYVTATTGSSNVMSKKVKARKLGHFDYESHFDDDALKKKKTKTSSLRVYNRRRKKAKLDESKPRILNKCSSERKIDGDSESKNDVEKVEKVCKNKISNYELQNLAVDSGFLRGLECFGSRETRGSKMSKFCQDCQLNKGSASSSVKRRVELAVWLRQPVLFLCGGKVGTNSFKISKTIGEVEGTHDELLNRIKLAAAEEKETHSFEVDPDQVENVKQRCLPNALNYPMLEEDDFRNDTVNADLNMELIATNFTLKSF